MIKITTKSQSTEIYFPKHWQPSSTALTITLKSTVRNDEKVYNVVDEDSLTDFFKFDIDTEDIDDGEYKYIVKEDDAVLSSGLVKVGVWKPENTEYNGTQEYIEYEG